jgi:methylthioribose-1-phosphate isomerase
MRVQSKNYRTIWLNEENEEVLSIIDQRYLPHQFIIENLSSVNQVVTAIKDMHVRGAGLIGATAGYGMYLAESITAYRGQPGMGGEQTIKSYRQCERCA